MSFYRIYRPKVFSEIDNSSVRKTLESLLKKKKPDLPHAFLFSGPHGTGKTTAARLVAKLFNCQKPDKNGAPCGTCDACALIGQGTHMDVLEIDAASNTGVDNIRDLREKIKLSPMTAAWKVYIIDEVHMLSTGAFNALLKTLEEPPKHAIFVLATTDPQKVPPTIISRCVHIVFSRPSEEEVVTALERIAKAEKISIETNALEEISRYAGGSFRDAVKLLEQANLSGEKISSENLGTLLHMSDASVASAFIDALARRDPKAALDLVATLAEEGADIQVLHTRILERLHEALRSYALVEAFSHALSLDDVKALVSAVTRSYDELRISPLPTLPLELAVVEFCATDAGAPVKDEKPHAMHKSFEVESVKSIQPSAKKPRTQAQPKDANAEKSKKATPENTTPSTEAAESSRLVTIEKVTTHWNDVIAELKPYNHSIAGLLRSTRPKSVEGGKLTIEAFYDFHHEKLSTPATRTAIGSAIKKLFGEAVGVEVVRGSK